MFRMLERLFNLIPFLHAGGTNDAEELRGMCRERGEEYTGEWFNRRGWIFFGKSCSRQIEYQITTYSSPALRIAVDPGEGQFKLHASIGFLSIWISFTEFLPSFFYPKSYEEKEISVTIHHGSIWISLWAPSMNWTKKDWFWSFNPKNILLGKMDYTEETVEEIEVPFALPERTYMIKIKRYWGVWKRRRFPWRPCTFRLLRVDMKPDKPIPVPGKGESAWDQGDNPVMNATHPAATIGEALGSLYDSIHRSRTRHGSGMSHYVSYVIVLHGGPGDGKEIHVPTLFRIFKYPVPREFNSSVHGDSYDDVEVADYRRDINPPTDGSAIKYFYEGKG